MVLEAYCNYSLDVCLQALGPCGVGPMPTVLGLVYVAVWIDPQPQSRLSTGPHPVVNISDIIQLRGFLCVYTRVCVWTTRIYGDPTKPRHRAAHLEGRHRPGDDQEARAASWRAAVRPQRLVSFCLF